MIAAPPGKLAMTNWRGTPKGICKSFGWRRSLGQGLRTSWLTLTFLAASVLSLAHAASYPDLIGFEDASLVDDADLDQMFGRFVQGRNVTYFGIQMLTEWQTSDGVIMNAGVDWAVDLSGPVGSPTASFFHTSPDSTSPSIQNPDPGIDLGADHEIFAELGALDFLEFGQTLNGEPSPLPITAGAGGLEVARGAVQSIQAAGDGNRIGNELHLVVSENRSQIFFGTPNGALGVPEALDKTKTVEFETGAKATAFVEDNAIGLVVKIRDLGTVFQEIRGGIGRAAQHVNVGGKLNFIRNTMNINFGLGPGLGGGAGNIAAALRLLKGLRQ